MYPLSLSFLVCFSRWRIGNLYVVFPYSVKKRVIADCWLRNKYSVRLITNLEQVVTHWNAILFQLVYGSTIYRPVCLFPYIKLQSELWPSRVCQRGFSISVMGKSWPHSATSNYLYLFVWVNLCICLSYFSNRLSVTDQKPNWNVRLALEKYIIGILSYTDSWCLVAFSINISWDRVCVCFGYHNQEQCEIWVIKWRSSLQRGVHRKKIQLQSPSP